MPSVHHSRVGAPQPGPERHHADGCVRKKLEIKNLHREYTPVVLTVVDEQG